MEIIVGILLGISFILNIILFIRGFSLVKQIEQLSDLITQYDVIKNDTETTLENMLESMRELDLKGSFESDDEVGVVFTELKQLIETYKNDIE